jgi:hypothetical protein
MQLQSFERVNFLERTLMELFRYFISCFPHTLWEHILFGNETFVLNNIVPTLLSSLAPQLE